MPNETTTPANHDAKRNRSQQSPTQAAKVHDRIRAEGEKELIRTVPALFWSALAAGLSMSFSMLAKGLLASHLPDSDIGFLVASLGYTVGFLLVILARQQLFTENTVTAVLPLMSEPRFFKLLRLLRLWSTVLIGNLLGTAIAAYAIIAMPLFDDETHKVFIGIGQHLLDNDSGEMFAKGVIAGWLIATMVWLIPAAGQAKIWVILIVTYLVAIGGFTHIIIGSTEVLYLLFSGKVGVSDYLFGFVIPVLGGNVIGGTFIFALISHAQIRSDN